MRTLDPPGGMVRGTLRTGGWARDPGSKHVKRNQRQRLLPDSQEIPRLDSWFQPGAHVEDWCTGILWDVTLSRPIYCPLNQSQVFSSKERTVKKIQQEWGVRVRSLIKNGTSREKRPIFQPSYKRGCLQGSYGGSQVVQVVKNPPTNAGDMRDVGSIPGLGRSPGGGLGNPLQYSCLKNPMDRGACRATVHRIAQSWTRLKQLSLHRQGFYASVCHDRCLGQEVYPQQNQTPRKSPCWDARAQRKQP